MKISNIAKDSQLEPRQIAAVLRTSIDEIAMTVGMSENSLQCRSRAQSNKTQRCLRELVEVLAKVEPWFGSDVVAYAWYRSEPLPGFDGRTAMHLVQDGKAQHVFEYIDAVDAGIFT